MTAVIRKIPMDLHGVNLELIGFTSQQPIWGQQWLKLWRNSSSHEWFDVDVHTVNDVVLDEYEQIEVVHPVNKFRTFELREIAFVAPKDFNEFIGNYLPEWRRASPIRKQRFRECQ